MYNKLFINILKLYIIYNLILGRLFVEQEGKLPNSYFRHRQCSQYGSIFFGRLLGGFLERTVKRGFAIKAAIVGDTQ